MRTNKLQRFIGMLLIFTMCAMALPVAVSAAEVTEWHLNFSGNILEGDLPTDVGLSFENQDNPFYDSAAGFDTDFFQWTKWDEYGTRTDLGLTSAAAVADGVTHYGVAAAINFNSGTTFADDMKLYVNGTDVTSSGYTSIVTSGELCCFYIDLGLAKEVCTVDYVMNGGTPVAASEKIEKGSKAAEPAEPSKEDEVFLGWYSNPELTDKYDFNSAVNSDITLYAKFATPIKIDTASLTFVAPVAGQDIEVDSVSGAQTPQLSFTVSDGGNYSVSEMASGDKMMWVDNFTYLNPLDDVTLDSNTEYSIVLTLQADEGYYFANDSDIELNGKAVYGIISQSSDSTQICVGYTIDLLSAPGSYNITFNATGGYTTPAPAVTGTDGKLSSLPIIARNDYDFRGWYTAEVDGTPITLDTVFTEDTEVFAHWEDLPRVRNRSSAHSINTIAAENGSISVSMKKALSGSVVTITVNPDEGYKLDKIKVTDQVGREIEITKSDDEYTFVMADDIIWVTPVFVEENSGKDKKMTSKFYDITYWDYFYDAVVWATDKGITSGTTEYTFSPNDACTRAQTVAFLWRAAGSPEPQSYVNPFVDVKYGDYFYKAVLWAYENGIVYGTSAYEFSPYDTVTRGQTVTFLYRFAGEDKKDRGTFADIKSNDYYYDAVFWAYENDITNGTGNDTFGPDDDCLRGQIVTFLYRYYC